MKIEVELQAGQKLKASFGDHEITSDQSPAVGGDAEFPEPFDYFLASMPLCAAFFARAFCQKRDISTEGLAITQEHTSDSDNKYKKHITLHVTLPEDFPTKYEKALLAAINSCTVKKVIQEQPEFSVELHSPESQA